MLIESTGHQWQWYWLPRERLLVLYNEKISTISAISISEWEKLHICYVSWTFSAASVKLFGISVSEIMLTVYYLYLQIKIHVRCTTFRGKWITQVIFERWIDFEKSFKWKESLYLWITELELQSDNIQWCRKSNIVKSQLVFVVAV